MQENIVRAMLEMAEIDYLNVYKIENKYWPDSYVETKNNSPWWLIHLPIGMMKIGWRKRVISIEWNETPIRGIITKTDETTRNETMAHAWTYAKAVEYLTELGKLIKEYMFNEKEKKTKEK